MVMDMMGRRRWCRLASLVAYCMLTCRGNKDEQRGWMAWPMG